MCNLVYSAHQGNCQSKRHKPLSATNFQKGHFVIMHQKEIEYFSLFTASNFLLLPIISATVKFTIEQHCLTLITCSIVYSAQERNFHSKKHKPFSVTNFQKGHFVIEHQKEIEYFSLFTISNFLPLSLIFATIKFATLQQFHILIKCSYVYSAHRSIRLSKNCK